MKKETLDFEAALKKLEAIVQKLEDPDVPLQDGFALYRGGDETDRRDEKGAQRDRKESEDPAEATPRGDLQETDFAAAENE